MKNFILFLLFVSNVALAQQNSSSPVTYKYGRNGIEIIAKTNDGTIVVSTFKAKPTIKDEIAESVLDYYTNNENVINQTVTFKGKEATVTGKYVVEKKDSLTSVNFVYQKVEWNTGLVEVSE
jgi:hypothetical protein